MIPLMLGTTREHLYAVFYPAVPSIGLADFKSRPAVLMCPPGPQEAARVWWLYRNLATRLSRMGFPVLRFDYAGTGDSFGNPEEFGPKRWQLDIAETAHELVHMTGAKSLVFFGTRVGALLLSSLGDSLLPQVPKEYLLLDPVAEGEVYVKSMQWRQQERIKRLRYHIERFISADQIELLGYPISQKILDEYASLSMTKHCFADGAKITAFFHSADTSDTGFGQKNSDMVDFEKWIRKVNPDNGLHIVPHHVLWDLELELEKVIFSVQAIDAIAGEYKGGV